MVPLPGWFLLARPDVSVLHHLRFSPCFLEVDLQFFLFCFAFFVMIWSQTQPCFNVWIWILLNFALFSTQEQLTAFGFVLFCFFSLSPVLNVHS